MPLGATTGIQPEPPGRWSPASLRDPGPPTKDPGERFPGLGGPGRAVVQGTAAADYSRPDLGAALRVSWLLPEEPQRWTLFPRDLEELSPGQERGLLPQP